MGWLPIDLFGFEIDSYNHIGDDKHDKWIKRINEKTVVRKNKGTLSVQGSEKQYPWRFLSSIPVK